MKQANFNVFYT